MNTAAPGLMLDGVSAGHIYKPLKVANAGGGNSLQAGKLQYQHFAWPTHDQYTPSQLALG